MCFRTRGKFTKSKISMLIGIPNFLFLFGQFPILNFGIGHSGSEPFICSSAERDGSKEYPSLARVPLTFSPSLPIPLYLSPSLPLSLQSQEITLLDLQCNILVFVFINEL